ncbi:MAG TPA: HAMP domain-containing protein [Candidatus Binatia bacterium]|jgi:methyl-accepting chemotaxis protein
MTQPSASVESRSLPISVREGARRIGLMGKIVGTLAGVIVLFGLLVLGVVYHLTGRALRAQLDQRALAIVTTLGDAAGGHVIARNSLELHALVTKYALLDGVAYAVIRDGKGEIMAQSMAALPAELRESVSLDARRQAQRRELILRGKAVYETRVPILGGQAGTAHIGVWGDGVEGEIRRALLPLAGIVVALLLAGVALSALLARGIVRPILLLTQVADKISKGDLETPVGVETRDEIGDLARSLGRMRASLKAAMVRLNQSRNPDHIAKE